MKSRLFRSVPHRSGLTLAAVTAGLMSFHGLPSAGDGSISSQRHKVAAHQIGQTSGVRSGPTVTVTKVDFISSIFHNPFP